MAKVSVKQTPDGVDDLPAVGEELRYAISLLRQGGHRFYTLSMPSDVLASCSFATSKDEDPEVGFQRVLDVKRAQEIADYIDAGGTIPSSVVLSAQADSGFRSVDRSKTGAFKFTPHSFLIIDGQHRVYGFSKAKTVLRVPVVIYDNLSKEEEARLFIDINTKQRPVSKELLLAIKSLANSESDIEARLGQVFDLFDTHPTSALLGATSSTKKAVGKVDRVTFNAGLRPYLGSFDGRDVSYVFKVWNAYMHAIMSGLRQKGVDGAIGKKTTFRAFCEVFPDVVQRVQDKFDGRYTSDNFSVVIKPVFTLKSTFFSKPPTAILDMAESMKKAMRSNFAV